jgi:hypothetical protein
MSQQYQKRRRDQSREEGQFTPKNKEDGSRGKFEQLPTIGTALPGYILLVKNTF